ncbi:MAG: hypothetical protein QF858_01140 [Candidatus Pacebacteria bacterium]|jgi:hypothetical protein|nr:hypothetical protein [bacterium]MDP6527470.1 hypothetical protein [Candidatus Paceibacterota bacterium]MDP6659677.1 hypothetical protein [Candidatus Paceibacterota bacterium]|tara:strand:+ start:16758 stop:17021 length:264 start_codon:yes stop_codon:yes gene_type:complete
MWIRLTLSILLFISILLLPWWVSGILALTLLIFRPAYEVIIAGLLIDLLYGNVETLPEMLISFTTGAAALFIVMHILRGRLIFYEYH